MSISKLKNDPKFQSLSREERQTIYDAITVGEKLPIAEEVEKMGNGPEQIAVQLNTVLVTLRGEPGTGGGLVGEINAMNAKIDRFVDLYHSMDKKHDLLEQGNEKDHQDIREDIAGIGRKAERAIVKTDKLEADFETYRTARIEEKEESKFRWYHAVIAGFGATAVLLEILSMCGIIGG